MNDASRASDTEDTPDAAQRLSKVVAAQVPCSRREAEQYIAEGWVRVDGQRVEEPQARVSLAQRVEVDPKARLQPPVSATLLLHKPAGMGAPQARALLDAAHHWTADRSGVRRTKAHTVGLQALLALPPQASGLAVFSQDRSVIRKLSEDAALVEQELLAEVTGTIAPDGLARLQRGLLRDRQPMPPARVSWQSERRLRFAVKGIEPSAIGWMCAQVGLELVALHRLRIGRVPLAGVPAGQWRYLPPGERF